MPTWAAWILGVALCLLIGAVVGYGSGAMAERTAIANECRQAGAFTVSRTGFQCVPNKAKEPIEY